LSILFDILSHLPQSLKFYVTNEDCYRLLVVVYIHIFM